MKYIRTKDGQVMQREFAMKGGGMFYSDYMYDEEGNLVFDIDDESTYLLQADTIEELCDGYIIVPNTQYGIPFTRRIDDFDFLRPLDTDITEAIYGFIRTDKGLIYVAKMNEKGKLCLI